jgi:hypothetical protein
MPVRIWIYRGDFFFTESIGLIEDVRTRRFAPVSEARVLLTLRSAACAAGGGKNPNSGTRWAVSHMLDALALSVDTPATKRPKRRLVAGVSTRDKVCCSRKRAAAREWRRAWYHVNLNIISYVILNIDGI